MDAKYRLEYCERAMEYIGGLCCYLIAELQDCEEFTLVNCPLLLKEGMKERLEKAKSIAWDMDIASQCVNKNRESQDEQLENLDKRVTEAEIKLRDTAKELTAMIAKEKAKTRPLNVNLYCDDDIETVSSFATTVWVDDEDDEEKKDDDKENKDIAEEKTQEQL